MDKRVASHPQDGKRRGATSGNALRTLLARAPSPTTHPKAPAPAPASTSEGAGVPLLGASPDHARDHAPL